MIIINEDGAGVFTPAPSMQSDILKYASYPLLRISSIDPLCGWEPPNNVPTAVESTLACISP